MAKTLSEAIQWFQRDIGEANLILGISAYPLDDGIWGSETRGAMQTFQAAAGITLTNLPNEQTYVKLYDVELQRSPSYALGTLLNDINVQTAAGKSVSPGSGVRLKTTAKKAGPVVIEDIVPPPPPAEEKKGIPTWGWALLVLGGMSLFGGIVYATYKGQEKQT